MLYSLAGGLLSLLAMILAKKSKGLSIVGVSVLGAVSHNVAQMIVACFVVETRAILAYLPILLAAAAATGTLTGLIARYTFHGLRASHTNDRKREKIDEQTGRKS